MLHEGINLFKNVNLTEKSGSLHNIVFLIVHKIWVKKFITLEDNKIEEGKFQYQKNLILLEDVDIKNTGV